MRNYSLFLFLFLSLFVSVQSEEAANILPHAEVDGDPSAIIAGCVSAITGNYSDVQVDLVLNGPEQLFVRRLYCSADWKGGSLGDGWNHNHDPFGRIRADIKNKYYWARLPQPSGGSMLYTSDKRPIPNDSDVPAYHPGSIRLDTTRKKFRKGLSNTGSGYIGGSANLKNQSIVWRSAGRCRFVDVELADGGTQTFKQSKDTFRKWNESGPLRLQEEKRPSGNRILYSYEDHNQNKRLGTVKATDATGQKEYGCLHFSKPNWTHRNPELVITASDGRQVVYTFSESKRAGESQADTRHYLTSVKRPNAPPESYVYSPAKKKEVRHERVIEKHRPDGRFQFIKYYEPGVNDMGGGIFVEVKRELEKDLRAGKVRVLEAPVGIGNTPVTTHRFFYQSQFPHKKASEYTSGQTEVRDALNHKTVYHYTGEDLLTKIERHVGTGHYSKYSSEMFYWGKGNDEGDLVCKALLEADDSVRSCRYLQYDAKHNVTAEHLLGNISGTNLTKPRLNGEGVPEDNGCERYTIHRTYSNNALKLLLSETLPNGRSITYRYWKDTPLVEAKLTRDHGRIVQREFREYNEIGAHTKTIQDNGSGLNSDDYTDVTVRRMTYIIPYMEGTCIGLPKEIAEKYYDATQTPHQEHFLGKVLNFYTVEGYLEKQEHYDARDIHQYTLNWQYDSMGNVILEQDALGRITRRRFDANGNKIYEQGPAEDSYTEYTFDYSNRLVAEQTTYTDGSGLVLSQSYAYDYLGNRTESVDIFGNKTEYAYDSLGRLVSTKQPYYYDVEGRQVRLETTLDYDIAGNIVAEWHPNGTVTKKEYNIRRQPISITHPDGTKERFEYNLEGTLRCQITPNGTRTLYHYDSLGNTLRKETSSSWGEHLKTTSATYRGNLCTSETDANDTITTHSYDAAGRRIETSKEGIWTRYEYDALGRQYKTKQWIGPGPDDVSVSIVVYDLLNRPIEECVEKLDGTLLSRVVHDYDKVGNRCATTTYGEIDCGTTRTFYNSQGKVWKVIDADGNPTITEYDYHHWNATHDQRVLQTTVTDALGNRTITTQNAVGQDVNIVRKDKMGCELALTRHDYDHRGYRTRTVETALKAGEPNRDFTTQWQYDVKGKLTALFEAVGTPKARSTHFSYNRFGEKTTDILPDGIETRYQYDDLGRLDYYDSSDHTISYGYLYDNNDNVLLVTDQVTGTWTRRLYDGFNRMTEETLANGLKITYAYDGMNRVTSMHLPEHGGVKYHYDTIHLKEVSRVGDDGQTRYSHHYLRYDLSGNLLCAQMIGRAGTIDYSRDRLGRVRTLKTAHIEETVPPFGFDQVGNLLKKQKRDPIGETHSQYAYDSLYQLIKEEGSFDHTYAYDSLYNRTDKDHEDCDIDPLNQLLRQGDKHYAYDSRGNRISDGDNQYTYDALGRLTRVQKSDHYWLYQYDPFNRRISKKCYDAQDQLISHKRYLYSDQSEIGSVDESGNLIQFRMLGSGLGAEIGAAVALEIHDQLFAPLHDFNGNVLALLKPDTGEVEELYRYTAFGEETCFRRTGEALWSESTVPSANPWRFASKRCDAETGLIHFGRRYYDPDAGRWTTPDPLGYDEGPNLYTYVRNRPLTHIDLWGLLMEMSPYGFSPQLVHAATMGVTAVGAYWNSQYGTSPLQITFDDSFESRCSYGGCSRRLDLKLPELSVGSIGSINGINCSEADGYSMMNRISSFAGDRNVHHVYNADHGFYRNACECGMGLGGIATTPVRKLHEEWDERLSALPEDVYHLHLCHSQGCIHTKNALLTYPEELRKRILVLAIAPGGFIPPELCGDVWHYVSTRDVVYLFDRRGYEQAKNRVIFLDPHPDSTDPFDHAFSSPTYNIPLQTHIDNYINSGGREF